MERSDVEPRYEAFRQAAITLGASLVIAAAVLGWTMPDPPKGARYEGFVVENKVVRLDTRHGHLVACDFNRCVRVLGNGKEIQSNSAPGLSAPAPSVPRALEENADVTPVQRP